MVRKRSPGMDQTGCDLSGAIGSTGMASEDLPGERQKRMGSKSEVSVQTELEHGRLTARIVRAARRKCRKAQECRKVQEGTCGQWSLWPRDMRGIPQLL